MGVIDDRDFIGYAATPPNPKWPNTAAASDSGG